MSNQEKNNQREKRYVEMLNYILLNFDKIDKDIFSNSSLGKMESNSFAVRNEMNNINQFFKGTEFESEMKQITEEIIKASV